ncbi:protein TILLER ANGLE CONTROL 1-like isoform X1 [Zingiber officinale]|nr:protein TILLER ANGLE CONTROL 1-like isoform X1 [Zingiber officinale]XP_042472812.1 protein TILLER ANGLE CONTROL 1-like isoform X1 [Zingiber officinale]
MKIFNWVHRKLYPNVKYSHVSGKIDVYEGDEEEKLEILESMEKKALLFHDVLDSILTIGTLGSQVMFVSESYCAKEDELTGQEEKYLEIEVTNEWTEVAPALVAGKPPSCIQTSKLKFPVEVEEKKMEIVHETDTAEKIQEQPLLMEDKEKREQRTTLADLFAADAMMVNSQNEKPNKKTHVRLKQYSIIHEKKKMQNRKEAKWITATAKGNTKKTTRKIQKLISKLLKKKVHPEMQGAR